MASDKTLANNVPMQGNGFYSSNSALQYAAMLNALPLLSASVIQKNTNEGKMQKRHLAAIEYGSAHGNNSELPMKEIIKLTEQSTDVQLHFNDRPENDFTTLSRNVTGFQWPTEGTRRVFTSMVPQSFYEPVVPPLSVDIGFSLACLHHLDHVDPRPEGRSPVDPERQIALRHQAKKDLRRFLNLRAEEFAPGGSLVLSFVSKASTGEENYPGPVDACRSALIDMVKEGLIPLEVAGEFEVPTYNRTLEDVRESLEEVKGEWAAEEVYEKKVLHPAVEEFAAKKQAHPQDIDAHRINYGNTVIDWLMAVVGGYFDKMLRLGLGENYSKANGELLLGEWVKRTKDKFLEKHDVEDVYCWFIYVRLTRLEGQ
ncbi:hypothetical protein PENVUL_c024G00282 [Penicillium vulpinum]|uniref:Methyltransferase type 11 domain-containing protein n=1 Tax=Penicillium vulpinum TaxID=29845 RepID=A0A1V6RV76_9EURO|nr:hypothetical protein PENVUL_c024G00282 [Penicillium vulpinum]